MAEKGTKRSLEVNDSSESFVNIGKNKRITVRKFKNTKLVDIREFYEAGGELKPGKKGISLTEDQWNTIVEHLEEIQEALGKLADSPDDSQPTKRAKSSNSKDSVADDDAE